MTLNEYLTNHSLLSNPPDFLNVSFLTNRIKSRYGFRRIRNDVSVDDIAAFAQNVIDINFDFLKNLFSIGLNPWETWSEKTSGTSETDGKNSGTSTQTTSANAITQNNVNAFNSNVSLPDNDSSQNSSGNSATTVNDTNSVKSKNSGTRTGFNFRDYEYALNHYRACYDILINLISVEILNLYVSPNDIMEVIE